MADFGSAVLVTAVRRAFAAEGVAVPAPTSRGALLCSATLARHLIAEHVGLTGSPPEPAEDVLILGVLAALLVAIGAQGVTGALDPLDPVVVFAENSCTEPPPGRATALWRFAWSSWDPGARPLESPIGTDLVSRARRLLAGNLTRGWTLGDLAAEFALSTRSLQRRLDDCGGFAALLGATRADAAGDLLIHSEHPLCVVGFGCGYVDQPHFTREFKRHTAMTPAAYRSAFARPLGGARPDSHNGQR